MIKKTLKAHRLGFAVLSSLAAVFLVLMPTAGASAHRVIELSVAFTSTPPSSTTATSATFAWTSTGRTVTCTLDSKAPVSCSSPVTYQGLALGPHKLNLTATSDRQTVSAFASWTIVATTTTPPPAPTPTPPPTTTPPPAPTPTPPTTPPPPAPTPTPTTVAAPIAPSTYAVPSGAVVVSSSAQLVSALSGSTANDIVLADGTYDSSSYFTDSNGSRLFAQHLGGAVLTAGLVVGGNSGPGGAVVQGLAFDVSSAAKTLQGSELITWGPAGSNLHVLDTTFAGHGVVPIGLNGYNPAGLVAQRLTFANLTDEGLRASDNATVALGAVTPSISSISDISVNGVTRSTPGASNGTAEAGIWIGHPVTNGVHRIRIRNVSSSGIETVNNAWNTTFTDLDIDMSGPNAYAGVAVYIEHFGYNLVFNRFQIRGSRVGITAEWNDPAWGSVAASHNTVVENGTIDAAGWTLPGHTCGIFLDQGTESTTASGVTFANQNFAAIDAFNTVGTNSFTNNTYGSVTPISTAHI